MRVVTTLELLEMTEIVTKTAYVIFLFLREVASDECLGNLLEYSVLISSPSLTVALNSKWNRSCFELRNLKVLS